MKTIQKINLLVFPYCLLFLGTWVYMGGAGWIAVLFWVLGLGAWIYGAGALQVMANKEQTNHQMRVSQKTIDNILRVSRDEE